MRRILGPSAFGRIFWLQPTAPTGYERWGFPSYLAVDHPARGDAAAQLASLINTSVPSMDMQHSVARSVGIPYQMSYQGERSLYRVPGWPERLQLLIRRWPGVTDGQPSYKQKGLLWASSCELDTRADSPAATPGERADMVWCAPGTGASMLQVLDGSAGLGAPTVTSGPRRCNWSQAAVTNYPDSGSRTCAALMPALESGQGGGVWVVGNTAGKVVYDRYTLTLSVATDGLRFDRHFVVRDRNSLMPRRFAGGGKNPGYAYPGGMWRGKTMFVVYSEGKENISVTQFPLASVM